METFLRFQTPVRCEQTARPLGIFASVREITDSSGIDESVRHWIGEELGWFNRNLPVPRLGADCLRPLFWFRSNSRSMVSRIWELVVVMRDCGLPVQMQRTNDPGRIVYSDEYQVAAVARYGERRPRRSWSALRV
jgi:hypothetical protein